MGMLQEIAGTASLKGSVVVTRANGGSVTYGSVAQAEAACGDLKGRLVYLRGAFFEMGAGPFKGTPGLKVAPPTAAPTLPPSVTKAPGGEDAGRSPPSPKKRPAATKEAPPAKD